MKDLGKQAVRGATITLGAQGAKFAMSLGITMVLARLLTPHDYGLFALATVFTGLVAIFRDGGLSVATVQRADISDAQLSTLFWLNTALGIGLAFGMAAISPMVGWFYDERSLVAISLALAVLFIFNGLGAQPQALLQRQLRFHTIAVIDIASLVLSSAAGIAAAVAGLGYWALVIMLILSAAVNAGLSCYLCQWRPSAPVRGAGIRAMMRFGGELTAMKFLDAAASSLDSLLLGKFFNAAAVGMYTRAQSLMLLPSSQIVPPLLSVSLPIMSRLSKDPPRLRQLFAELLCLTLLASSFISVILVTASDWLVEVMLGPQWTEVPKTLSYLAGPALFVPLSAFCVASMIALGEGRALIRWAFVKNVITAVAIVGGVPWGAKGVALSLSIASLLLLLPIMNHMIVKSGLIASRAIWKATGIGIGICAAGCLLMTVGRASFELNTSIGNLALFGLINALFHILALLAWPSSRHALARIIRVAANSRSDAN